MAALASMQRLNKSAAEVFSRFPVSACTDVTGFGLLGHACEMATDNTVGALIDSKLVPIVGSAASYAEMGLIPAGAYTNIDYRSRFVGGFEQLDETMGFVLFDPQTSGGLLASVPNHIADEVVEALGAQGLGAVVIGHTDAALDGLHVV
jgi:selenide,water dikinase